MKKTGDIVRIGKNDYIIGDRLGGGTEGNVFDFESKNEKYNKYVIKLISDNKLTKSQINNVYEHLQWLSEKNTKDSDIPKYVVLPVQILASDLGYVMRKTVGYSSLKNYLNVDIDDFDKWYKEKYTLKKRYEIIKSLFKALYTIHSNGMIFTDLSPNNIMVNDNKNNIVFIDCDNMRRRTDSYCGVLGTPGYMAPEIYRNSEMSSNEINEYAKKHGIDIDVDPKILTNCGTITADSDIFSAAIIAFQLLTLQHPFIGDVIDKGSSEEEEMAEKCFTDYIFKIGTTNTSTAFLTNYFEQVTTKEIRDLFYRIFVDGKNKPALRPTDKDFYEAFARASESIVICDRCKFEQLYIGSGTKCVDCGESYGDKVILDIFMNYKDTSRMDLINQIGNYPEINVGPGVNFDFNGKEKKTKYLLSTIVFEPGIERRLYLRHFESTMERNSDPCIILTLSKEDTEYVSLLINTKLVDNPKYSFVLKEAKLYRTDGESVFIEKEKNFKWKNHLVFFGQKIIGKAKMQIYGRFRRG